MTEADWLACTEPEMMLEQLGRHPSGRKWRLVLCAWACELRHLLGDERSWAAVETAELFADGLVSAAELVKAHNAAQEVWRGIEVRFGGRHSKADKSSKGAWSAKRAAEAARNAADPRLDVLFARRAVGRADAATRVFQSQRLRDVFGNPFRPCPPLAPSVLAWNNGLLLKLAAAIYDERAFDRLPVLADALEDAGCQDQDILGHCRAGGEHVRGCWVVDLALGKG
jgi:hypothetical protein